MSKKATAQFWDTAHRYLGPQLKVIRQVSSHTIDSYRDCLNSFIDYLERVENISRKKISFHNFGKETIKRYQMRAPLPESRHQTMRLSILNPMK